MSQAIGREKKKPVHNPYTYPLEQNLLAYSWNTDHSIFQNLIFFWSGKISILTTNSWLFSESYMVDFVTPNRKKYIICIVYVHNAFRWSLPVAYHLTCMMVKCYCVHITKVYMRSLLEIVVVMYLSTKPKRPHIPIVSHILQKKSTTNYSNRIKCWQ